MGCKGSQSGIPEVLKVGLWSSKSGMKKFSIWDAKSSESGINKLSVECKNSQSGIQEVLKVGWRSS